MLEYHAFYLSCINGVRRRIESATPMWRHLWVREGVCSAIKLIHYLLWFEKQWKSLMVVFGIVLGFFVLTPEELAC